MDRPLLNTSTTIKQLYSKPDSYILKLGSHNLFALFILLVLSISSLIYMNSNRSPSDLRPSVLEIRVH